MRYSQAPEQWARLLKATTDGNYDLAHKICKDYKFDVDSKKQKRTASNGNKSFTFAMSPDGTIYKNKFAKYLSLELGFSPDYVGMMITTLGGRPVKQGNMKGWTFWKEVVK